MFDDVECSRKNQESDDHSRNAGEGKFTATNLLDEVHTDEGEEEVTTSNSSSQPNDGLLVFDAGKFDYGCTVVPKEKCERRIKS